MAPEDFMCSLTITSRKYMSEHLLTSGITWEQNPILQIWPPVALVPKGYLTTLCGGMDRIFSEAHLKTGILLMKFLPPR